MKATWQQKKLGDVIRLEYGKPLPDERRKANGKYPVYGANGEKGRTNEFYVSKPTIIVGRKGSAGEINLTEDKFWPLDVTYYVDFDDKLFNLGFLFNLLDTLNLPGLAKGVKPGINRNEVYALDVQVPPLPEQKRIVTILDEALEGIAAATANAEKNLSNARELFERYLQTVFIAQGKGWLVKNLGELATFRNGINFTKSSNGEAVRIVGVKDFQQHFYAPVDDLESVITEGKLPVSDFLKPNDILFVRSNGNLELIGRSMLIGELSEKTTFSGFTIRARLNDSSMFPEYLCHYLKSGVARRTMIDGGNGVNIKSLNQTTLSELAIPVPPSIKEQKAVVNHLESLSNDVQRLETVYKRKLTALAELKKSILHQAFTGQLH